MRRVDELLQAVWMSHEDRPTIIISDSTIAEVLNWHEVDLSGPFALFDLSADHYTLEAVAREKAERVLFFLSSLDANTLNLVKKQLVASSAPVCCILTSVCPWSALHVRPPSVQSTSHQASHQPDNPYDFVEELLLPAQTSVRYIPAHVLELTSGQTDLNFSAYILANHHLRPLSPLTLLALRGQIRPEPKSMSDVTAAELPVKLRAQLKMLAHDVSSALVLGLGLDPSHCIYALGKTSSLVGHSVLNAAESLTKSLDRRHGLEAHRQLSELFSTVYNSSASPAPCSLILVDRFEDLHSALTALGAQSCVQRVLNTCRLPQATTMEDEDDESTAVFDHALSLSVQPELLGSPGRAVGSLYTPLGAVSGLPFHPILSLQAPPALRSALYSLPEEQGRGVLSATLRGRIDEENGNFVAKKRGVGAEMLALVTALINAPGKPGRKHKESVGGSCPGYSPSVAIRHCAEVSATLAYVEAMQRSAAKQFSHPFRLSYDLRASREQLCLHALLQGRGDAAAALAALAHLHQTLGSATSPQTAPRKATAAATSKTKEAADEDTGPTDIVHFFSLLVSVVAICRERPVGFSIAESAAPILVKMLRDSTREELVYLQQLGLLMPGGFCHSLLSSKEGQVDVGEDALLRGALEMLRSVDDLQQQLSAPLAARGPHPLLDFLHDADSGVALSMPADQRGLLVRIVQECLFLHAVDPQACTLQRVAEYVESPLKQMARAGLGLLSKGFGLLGGTPAPSKMKLPHPAEQSVVVVFVLGGITSSEVVQVRHVVEQFGSIYGQNKRVVLLSNALLSGEEALSRLLIAGR